MPPFRIVKVIDVVRDLDAGQFGCQIRVIEGHVAFEGAEERFRHGIVPTISPSAHAANDPIGFQRGLVFVAGIGAPSVRVVEEAKGESATLDGGLQCRQGQLRVIAAALGIAHHPTREEIQDHREIEPAHLRPNVGDITDPALVRPGHFELAVEQVGSTGSPWLESVVRQNLRRCLPTMPADCIRRATRLRPTCCRRPKRSSR